jgi:hypothetical protein
LFGQHLLVWFSGSGSMYCGWLSMVADRWFAAALNVLRLRADMPESGPIELYADSSGTSFNETSCFLSYWHNYLRDAELSSGFPCRQCHGKRLSRVSFREHGWCLVRKKAGRADFVLKWHGD